MKSIRTKLTITVIFLLAAVLGLLSVLTYGQTKKLLQEHTKYDFGEIAENQAEAIKMWLDIRKAELGTMARSPIILSGDREAGLAYLRSEWKNNPLYENIIWAEPSGRFIAADGTIGMQTTPEEFQQVLNGETIIQGPLTSPVTGKLVVSIVTPIIKDGQIIGELGIPVIVEGIVDQVLTVKRGTTGYAYIVNKDGLVVIHPDKDVANQKNVLTNPDTPPALKVVTQKMTQGEKGFASYFDDSIEKFIAYAPIPGTSWSIAINVPVSEVNEDLILLTRISLVIIVGVLIIAIFFIFPVASFIVKPIEILEAAVNRIADGDLSLTRVNVDSKDEIGRLSRAFEKMVTNLDNSYQKQRMAYEELEAVYEELSASEEELHQQYDELQVSQEALRASEERFMLAVEAVNDEIWDWDIKGSKTIKFYKYGEILGLREEILTSKELFQKIHPEDVNYVKKAMFDHLHGINRKFEVEHREKTRSNEYRWFLIRGKSVLDNNSQPIRMIGIKTDISELKKSEEKILYLAHYDQLTGLPNRNLFNDKLSFAILGSRRNQKKIVVLYLDLDNFKTVNDTLGHNYGDLLLKEVGRKLRSTLREVDIVARLGGDEFGIIFENVEDNDYISDMIKRITECFRHPVNVQGNDIFITISLGITICPDDGENVDDLLINADTAMYNAKTSGKDGFSFYKESMNIRVINRLEIENSLRRAIEKNELVLHYQPLVDLASGRIEGLEALVRWEHPTRGLLSPLEFIPIAEETGQISQIGEWVFRSACKQLKSWHNMGYFPLKVSVNLSARCFKQADLGKGINSILLETGVAAESVELEITESMVIGDLGSTITLLDNLKEYGVKIALDDFGTGYSSLNYLKLLPIDILKIDKVFLFDIVKDVRQKEIAKTIVDLAHNLGLEVVAEGVETEETYHFLKSLQCNRAQGFIFSKPLPPNEVEKLFGTRLI